MESWQERTALILGESGLDRLHTSYVAVVGAGGVGAAAAEMLVRAGVGRILLVDNDSFSPSNINRQLPALHSTVGKPKTEVLRSRILDINPAVEADVLVAYVNEEYLSQNPDVFDGVDFLVDAIDTLSPKIALIQHCLEHRIPLVSSMGSGAKMDVSCVRIADISKTFECPLAHMLRKRLHKLGIRTGFEAVFSIEKPVRGATVLEESENKKSQVGSISYLPTVFGCACAQAAISHLVQV